jgi:hypothetical protein
VNENERLYGDLQSVNSLYRAKEGDPAPVWCSLNESNVKVILEFAAAERLWASEET